MEALRNIHFSDGILKGCSSNYGEYVRVFSRTTRPETIHLGNVRLEEKIYSVKGLHIFRSKAFVKNNCIDCNYRCDHNCNCGSNSVCHLKIPIFNIGRYTINFTDPENVVICIGNKIIKPKIYTIGDLINNPKFHTHV